MRSNGPSISVIIAGAFGVLVFAALMFTALGPGLKSYNRWEARNEASNQVEINRIKIRQHEQLVEIEGQEAERRIVEAQGIAESQRIIDESLTNDYLTYLAIQAQMEMANSPNHTTVYVPSGEMGIPLVRDVTNDE